MSFVTHAHPERATGFFERATAALSGFAASYAKALAFRRTYAELSRLSDRELDDLGLQRSNVAEAARVAVYGG